MLRGFVLIVIGAVTLARANTDTCASHAAGIGNAVQEIQDYAAKRLANVSDQSCTITRMLHDELDVVENCTVNPLPRSCEEVFKRCPSSGPGYYSIVNQSNCTEHVYCVLDPDPQTCPYGRGWKRVGYFNMSVNNSCPSQISKLYKDGDGKKLACGRGASASGCGSMTINVGKKFSEVCGKVIGYQYWSPDALNGDQADIHSSYVDGVSLTHGTRRHHIWTFMAAHAEKEDSGCPCARTTDPIKTPPYITDDYTCESGNNGTAQARTNSL